MKIILMETSTFTSKQNKMIPDINLVDLCDSGSIKMTRVPFPMPQTAGLGGLGRAPEMKSQTEQ